MANGRIGEKELYDNTISWYWFTQDVKKPSSFNPKQIKKFEFIPNLLDRFALKNTVALRLGSKRWGFCQLAHWEFELLKMVVL